MKKLISEYTHDEIATWAAHRLVGLGYPVTFANMTSTTAGEQPDVLGMDSWADSILIEVKVSRSDFLADKKKPWRKSGMGIGGRRVYLTPKGLLTPADVPYGWELWEIHGKVKPILHVVKGKAMILVDNPVWGGKSKQSELRHCDNDEMKHFRTHEQSYRQEAMWAIKVLNRMYKAGIDIRAYADAKELRKLGVKL